MPKNKKRTLKDKQAAKKAAVLGSGKQGGFPTTTVVGLAAVVVVIMVFFLGGISKTKGPQAKDVTPAASYRKEPPIKNRGKSATLSQADYASPDERISYQASYFDDGKVRYYRYNTGDGIEIRYFVLKSSDGVVRAAFDACDVCWRAGRGYQQSGDFMVCRNCGRRFASVQVNEVQGGCNPAPLARNVEGGNIVIKVDDILKGRQYFNFGKRW